MLFHTIPDILSYANEAYGADDAIRWKKSKMRWSQEPTVSLRMIQTALPMPSKSLAKRAAYRCNRPFII